MNKIFEKGGKLHWLHSTVDAFETFLRVPGTVTRKGSHVRDAIDLKRILIIVLIAAAPAALFGMWNVGYQHSLAIGDTGLNILSNFWYGFLKVLPLYVVSYVVGLGIEFAASQIRGEEVSEGFLVSGFFIPLIVPADIPLWMLALAVAFAVIFGKEVFGGTGMNIWNPALLTRAFLFFSYPSYMSGSECWISLRKTDTVIDGFTGATPLALDGAPAQYGTGFWDLFIGTVPGSVGETSVIACYMQLLYGGFAFGAVFMATDPVTSAQTETGKWIYGILIGALCLMVRLFNPGYVEGMMLAILLANTFAPLIDHLVINSHLSRKAKKLKAA